MSLFGAPKVSLPPFGMNSSQAANRIELISSLQPASALVNQQQQGRPLPLHLYLEDSVRNQQRAHQPLLLVHCSVEVNSSNNRLPADYLVSQPSVNSLSSNNREPRVDCSGLAKVKRINSSNLNNSSSSRTGRVQAGCSGVVARLEDSGSTSRPLLPPLANLKRTLNSLKGSFSSLSSINSSNNSNSNNNNNSKLHHGQAAQGSSWNPSSRLIFPVTCCSRISRRNSQIPPRLS